MCPGHSHKKCRTNRKCGAEKKSLLVWASSEELTAMKRNMHHLMKVHQKQARAEQLEKGQEQKLDEQKLQVEVGAGAGASDIANTIVVETVKLDAQSEQEQVEKEQVKTVQDEEQRVVYSVEDDSQ